MSMTLQEEAACREILAEEKAKLARVEDEVVSALNGVLVRYWEGIPETVQDNCREFLKTVLSSDNKEVVEVSGSPSPYDVSGEYFDVHETSAGYPVRKTPNNDFILKVVEDGGDYYWQISNEWDEVLYASNSQVDAPVDIDEAVWTAAGKIYVNLVDGRIMEDWFQTDDTGPYYTTSGSVAAEEVYPSTGVYGTVVDPQADNKIRGGTYRGGKVWTEKDDKGTWTIYQTLHILNEAHTYVLVGSRKTDRTTETRRLYERIPEAHVDSLVASLAALGSYAVVDVDAQKTDLEGVFDVYITLVAVNTGGDSIPSGRKETAYYIELETLYPNVAASGVSALINTALGSAVLVSSDLRKTRWDDVFDVYVRIRTLKTTGMGLTLGGSGGLFKTSLKVILYVKEANLASEVASLTALPLIENVRSSKSGEDGYWDIYYSEIVVPPSHIEYRNAQQFRENGYDGAFYSYVDGKKKVISGVDENGKETFAYYDHKFRVVSSYWDYYSKQWKIDGQVITVSYSSTQPAAPSVGEVRRLSNGLFEKRSVVNNHAWWN